MRKFSTSSTSTLAGALAAVALLAGCGSSHSAGTTTTAAIAAPQPGIGSTRTEFEAAHNSHETLSQEASYGLITTNAQNRVISYEANFATSMTDRERMNTLGGSALPSGSVAVAETSICKLWRSPKLRPLLGTEYARVTTVPGTAAAHIATTTIPSC